VWVGALSFMWVICGASWDNLFFDGATAGLTVQLTWAVEMRGYVQRYDWGYFFGIYCHDDLAQESQCI